MPFLLLLVIELAASPGEPWATRITVAQTAIWAAFVLAFLTELTLARSKRRYLRSNWLVALSLALPLLRILRVASALRVLRGTRAIRGLNLARVFTRTNRATRALRELLRVSQFAYLVILTALVTLSAAGAIVYFERGSEGAEITTYTDGLWWASNVVLTSGGPAEPVTAEGRVLAVALRVFGLAVIGYLTARIAVFFLRARDDDGERSDSREVARLRQEIARLADRIERDAHTAPRPNATPRAGAGTDREQRR